MGNSAKRDIKRAERAERQRKALELRKGHASYEQIGAALGVDKGQARRMVMGAIQEIIAEPAEEVVRLEIERLDAMALGLWKDARGGNVQAIDRVLRIQERRSAYLGLDKPQRLNVELTREIETILSRVRERCSDDVFEQVLAAVSGGDDRPEVAAGAAPSGASSDPPEATSNTEG